MVKKKIDKNSLWKTLILSGLIMISISNINPIEINGEANQKVNSPNYPYKQQAFVEINKPAWIQDDYNWYYYKSSRAPRGWVKVGETWYYRNGQGIMQAGWEKVSREDYYPNDEVELYTEALNEAVKESNDFNINNFNIFDFNTEFLTLVNKERTSLGVRPLNYHFDLQKGVNTRAMEMRNAGSISHTRPNGEAFPTVFNYLNFNSLLFYLGENIASRPLYTVSKEIMNKNELNFEKDLAEKFYSQYYTSPGHYENMIKANFTGLSVGLQELNGQLYNVMIFSG